MNQTKFVISRFENRNGKISWRVSGCLCGERIRKNFKTREEAIAEKAVLEIKAEQITSGLHSVATSLTVEQVRDAEAAFRRIANQGHSLTFCADYTLNNYRVPENEKHLLDAVTEYQAIKQVAHEKTLLSFRQLRSIKNELTTLCGYFPKTLVSEVTVARLLLYLERGKPSLKTYNNRRGILSTFFKFAYQQGWILTNLIERTPYHRINHRRGSAVTITAELAAKLMAFVEEYENGEMVPYFAICLFAGVRPCIRTGEITKLRAASVKTETGVIHIEPEVSKVRTKRLVTIQPNLLVWLAAYPLNKYPIIPKNAVNMHRKICDRFDLTHDVMRHTFISMFVGKYRSMGEAALQAGNSESIIRKHYLDLKSKEEAEQFFEITPKHAGVSSTVANAHATLIAAAKSIDPVAA